MLADWAEQTRYYLQVRTCRPSPAGESLVQLQTQSVVLPDWANSLGYTKLDPFTHHIAGRVENAPQINDFAKNPKKTPILHWFDRGEDPSSLNHYWTQFQAAAGGKDRGENVPPANLQAISHE